MASLGNKMNTVINMKNPPRHIYTIWYGDNTEDSTWSTRDQLRARKAQLRNNGITNFYITRRTIEISPAAVYVD